MNSLNIAGNLGRDAEARDVNGQTVVNFAVAVSIGFGERRHTVWVDCAYWGKSAAAVAQYLVKGQAVAVAGSFDLEEFTKRDGTQDKKLRVTVSQVTLMGRPESSSSSTPAPARTQAPAPAPAPRQAPPARPPAPTERELDDEIPF